MSEQVKPPGGGRPKRPVRAQASSRARRQAQRKLMVWGGVVTVAAGAVLFGIFTRGGSGAGSAKSGTGPRFAVGSPGPGAEAPTFKLASTAGGAFDLAATRGKTVLLYFQEGISCQPCWDQIRDMEREMGQLKALGIDELVSITSDPVKALIEKAADEKLTTPILSDPDLSLGRSYNANRYGMMGLSRYGHTFVVVGPDGRIRWRADYGGEPDYTMYVRMPALLAQLRAGLGGA